MTMNVLIMQRHVIPGVRKEENTVVFTIRQTLCVAKAFLVYTSPIIIIHIIY